MKKLIGCLILLCAAALQLHAQSGRGEIRQGNRHFKNEKFENSEKAYRKAAEDKKIDRIAEFNLGDALYRQKKFEEAGHQFEAAAASDAVKSNSAKAYHNLGNSLLQAGKIEESIEAYKNALRRNPADLDTKYNLSYAQMMKKKQDQQKQNDNKNQDNKDQNKDQQNKDQQQKDQQNKDQQNKDQQNKDQQQKPQDQKEQKADQQQSKDQSMKMSKEDAKRLLEALANDEKKVQDKVKKEKANASKVRTIKDW
ncbi:MAG: tetratricopeptide repeat protein [Bacteroidales bacterium]|nr:tetratricopeptide repeat protein [Bacteroidales bacterium]